MKIDFDVLQASFWSLTYVLIIFYNLRHHILGIPPIAILANFAWETAAMIQDIHGQIISPIHIAWFSLDLVIIVTYLLSCAPAYFKRKHDIYIYILSVYSICLAVFLFLFSRGGMLLSSFLIDCTMAIEYCVYSFRPQFAKHPLSIAISSAKLIGDLCAWVYYKSFSPAVFYIGLIVSLLNLICLGNTLLPLIHRAESRPPEGNA